MIDDRDIRPCRSTRKHGGRRISGTPGPALTDRPLISIITIVRNDRDHLSSTIQSVISQTYPRVEYVVVDGGSTDGSVDVIIDHEDHIDHWISEPDEGISDAFNKGLSLSSGEWILFLNAADSLARPDVLTDMALNFDRSRIITGYASTGSKLIPKRELRNEDPLPVRSMLSHQATIVHRSIFESHGTFDKGYSIRMDYEYWLRVLRHETFLFMDTIIARYAEGGRSSRNIAKYLLEELKANKKNLGLCRLIGLSRISFYLERYCSNALSR